MNATTRSFDGYQITREATEAGFRICDARSYLHRGGMLTGPVAFAVWAEIEIFTVAEIPALIAAAKRLAKRGPIVPGDLRSAAARACGDKPRRPTADESARIMARNAADMKARHERHSLHCRTPWKGSCRRYS